MRTVRRHIWKSLTARLICVWVGIASGRLLQAATQFSDDNWTTLGTGMNNTVWALAVSGTNVYAGGKFTMAGDTPANFIARWNGTSWSALGSGLNYFVRALLVSGTNLYVGGDFTTAGGLTAKHIARWNGTNWSALGFTGTDGYFVSAFAASGPNLFVGGSFLNADFTPTTHIGRWTGSWWTLGSGVNATVYALAASGTNLYVGGDFTGTGGGGGANGIARWDGIYWWNMGSGMSGLSLNSVYALAVLGTNVYAGGAFVSAGGVGTGPLARWNGSSWSALPVLTIGPGYRPSVLALATAGNDLYAGGDFTLAGGTNVNRIARWDGTSWSALGTGMNTNVWALAASGSDLYAGGEFTSAGGKPAAYIAHASLPLPALSIRRSGSDVTLSWPSPGNAGLLLEQADAQSPPATWVTNAASVADDNTNRSVIIPATNSLQFFRLRRP